MLSLRLNYHFLRALVLPYAERFQRSYPLITAPVQSSQFKVHKPYLCLIALLLSTMSLHKAHAEVRPGAIEVGLIGGYWEGSRNVDSSSTFGLTAGYHIGRVFSLELNHSLVPTDAVLSSELSETNPAKEEIMLQQGSLNFQVNLSAGSFVPYFNLGGGWLITPDSNSILTDVGFGARYFLTHDFALRFALTMWMSDLDFRAEPYDHFTLTLGVSQAFGGERDIDHDGVINPDDRCPTVAEDQDQFEDGDGCPDTDNDKDGIKDDEDQCRDEPEDEDGDRDEDGCPDLDDDNDGIPNAEDSCPKVPEDKDGFKDDDGCLDEDNDEDGFLDTQDKCPDQKESVNGFEDDDGCPEEDQDGDGIFDSIDSCDAKKEVFNGIKDEDGCPDALSPELTAMLGLQELRFKRGKLAFKRGMKDRFDALALALKKEMLNVEIVVAAKTQEVSDLRATLVKTALIERGVPDSQLSAKGVGSQQLPAEYNPEGKTFKKGWVVVKARVGSPLRMVKSAPQGSKPSKGVKPSKEAPKPKKGVKPSKEAPKTKKGVKPSKEAPKPKKGVKPSK